MGAMMKRKSREMTSARWRVSSLGLAIPDGTALVTETGYQVASANYVTFERPVQSAAFRTGLQSDRLVEGKNTKVVVMCT